MSVTEIISFINGFVPYLNTGVIVLIIGLVFEKFGFKITRKDFKRKPVRSLCFGLALVFLSGLFSIFIQTQMSGFQPFFAFVILIVVYLVFTQT